MKTFITGSPLLHVDLKRHVGSSATFTAYSPQFFCEPDSPVRSLAVASILFAPNVWVGAVRYTSSLQRGLVSVPSDPRPTSFQLASSHASVPWQSVAAVSMRLSDRASFSEATQGEKRAHEVHSQVKSRLRTRGDCLTALGRSPPSGICATQTE